MDDLRLYFFECGSLKTQVQFIKMNQEEWPKFKKAPDFYS